MVKRGRDGGLVDEIRGSRCNGPLGWFVAWVCWVPAGGRCGRCGWTGRASKCYTGGHGGIETKQARSRYKVLTGLLGQRGNGQHADWRSAVLRGLVCSWGRIQDTSLYEAAWWTSVDGTGTGWGIE